MNELKDLSKVQIRIRPDATLDQIDATKRKLLAKIDESVKGVMVDCHEVTEVSVDGLSMLHQLKSHADREKKRFCFSRVTPAMQESIDKHSGTFRFDLFGAPSEKKSRRHRESTKRKANRSLNERRIASAKRVGMIVLCVLPIVGIAEYFLVAEGGDGSAPVIVKSFEDGGLTKQIGPVTRFSIQGTVNAVVEGKLIPDHGATVCVWLLDSSSENEDIDNTHLAWVTESDEVGIFELSLPSESTASWMTAHVTITTNQHLLTDSSALMEVSRKPGSQPGPGRRSNVYEYAIESGRPLRIDSVFR